MKSLFIATLLLCLAAAVYCAPITAEDHETMAINFKMINEINSDPSSTWKAGVNRNLAGKTVAEMKRLLGFAKKEGQVRYSEEQMTTIKHYNEAKASAVKSVGVEEASKQFKTLGLPTNFDSRQQWGKCIHPIRNQEQCGSCWACKL